MHAMRTSLGIVCLLVATSQALADEKPTAPIADAAQKQDTAAVQELLAQGGPVNAAQVDGMTALHWATFFDDFELSTRLIKAGADVKARTRYGVDPLSIACMNGNARIVERLLEAGADPKSSLPGSESALMTASRTGQLAPVQLLLKHGADVNARERKGQNALMWAAAEGHLDVVNALLDAGADFRQALPSGFTPLFFAVREGRTSVALRLLKAGLDVDQAMRGEMGKKGGNALTLAVDNGHFETAVALLDAGANPNAQPKGYAPLHALTWVRKPIRGDGDPPPVGSGNVSGLDFVKAAVAHGADVNLRLASGDSGFADFTMTGSTAFVLAARTGDLPLMKVLLELGADPKIGNADGSSALLAASGIGDLGSGQESAGTEQEAIEAVKLLVQLGLDVNLVDENGETAMHGAAYQNWPKLIGLLAQNGADVHVWNQRNRWGWTPLLIAQGYREGNFRPDVATTEALERLMKSAGIDPPKPGSNIVANQQSWDKKKPKAGKAKSKASSSNADRPQPVAAETKPATKLPEPPKPSESAPNPPKDRDR